MIAQRQAAGDPRPAHPVFLSQWSELYALQRGLTPDATYQQGNAVRIFGCFLGKRPKTSHLDDLTVSRWVAWLEPRYAKRTVNSLRMHLLCLWRFVADEGAAGWPHRVRPAGKGAPRPVAWTMPELYAIREAASRAVGTFPNGTERALYYVTLIDVCYQTGLRRSDVWRLRQEQFGHDGVIRLEQHKTGWPHEPRVTAETLAAVRRLPDPPLANPFEQNRSFYRAWHREVIKPAGVRPGCMQQIRRSAATHLARFQPGEVQRFLGHKTADMQRHYVDRALALGPAPMPPAIPVD